MAVEEYNPKSLVTLREHFDQRFNDHCRLNDRDVQSLERTISVMKTEMDERFKAANEWRGTMSDKDKSFARNETVMALEKRVSEGERWRSNMEGRMTTYAAVIVFIVAVVGLAVKFLA